MKPVKRAFPVPPVEIRFQIYEQFFMTKSHDAPDLKARIASHTIHGPLFFDQLSLGTLNPDLNALILKDRTSAHTKVSLLLVNKTIYAEAYPFFHRFHVFHMPLRDIHMTPLPSPACLPAGTRSSLEKITRLELTCDSEELDSEADWNVASHLAFVLECCPQLKHLSVDMVPRLEVEEEILDSYHALRELWPRLSSLRVCLLELEDLHFMVDREIIAGETLWYYDGTDARMWELKRSCFVADRGRQDGLLKQWEQWRVAMGR